MEWIYSKPRNPQGVVKNKIDHRDPDVHGYINKQKSQKNIKPSYILKTYAKTDNVCE